MATNRKHERLRNMNVVVHDGGVLSGDPARFGKLVGVAQVNKAGDGSVTIDALGGYNLSVTANNGAIIAGDNVYYHDGATPATAIDNTATGGVLAGTAMAPVANNATAVIEVRLTGVPG